MDKVTERIDAILQERRMSRRQLAIAANIPASSFQAAMARGRNMTVEMLQAIAAVLDIPVSAFFEQERSAYSSAENELNSFVHDFLEELRASARDAETPIGEFLGLSSEKTALIDDKEIELSKMRDRIDWLGQDPNMTEERLEQLEYELGHQEIGQMKFILDAVLESRQSPSYLSEEHASLLQQLNDDGQKKLSACVKELFHLLIQIPSYQRSAEVSSHVQRDSAEMKDAFGGVKLPFDPAT